MAGHHAVDISKEQRHLGDLAGRLMMPAAVIGVAAIAIVLGMMVFGEHPERAYQSWLINFMFFLAISLGGLFFTIIHHVTRAGWSVTIRRLAEAVAANFWVLALLFIPVLMGMFSAKLFLWNQDGRADADALLHWKIGYLNESFFTIRAIVYFVIWIGLSQFFFRLSVKQDSTGDVRLSKLMQKISAPAIILFGLSLTFAAFDWLKSLDWHFFSTIWGVYYFAGCAASFFGIAIIAIVFLKGTGRLRNAVTVEHLHDLGKLLFAFGMVFWAYIAFSQYMLIWYGNIPEETLWFQPRVSGLTGELHSHVTGQNYTPGAWNTLSIFLLIGHFAAPFVLLISRVPKRRVPLIAAGALWMIIMCWFDLFWLVMPVFHPGHPEQAFAGIWMDLLTFVGMGGIILALTVNRLRNLSLIPEKDPRLHESLAFENV